MRVALVHDYLTQFGGAERVLEALCEIFPEAPIFTLLYDGEKTRQIFGDRRIKTSFLQKIPFVPQHHRFFPVFMPFAIEQLDPSGYDLVISDSASFAKGIVTKPETLHICYCHTPLRFAWDDSQRYIEEFRPYPMVVRRLAPFFITYVRIWDRAAAERVDRFLANSEFVRSRIRKYYGQDARVLYPPVKFADPKLQPKRPALPGNGAFLMVGRLVSYKRFDLAISTFNDLGWPLRIVGDGPELSFLKREAKKNISFLGTLSDEDLWQEYEACRALLFPQEEDFGIVAVEAMAAGKPVLAFRGGGVLETITEGVTGMFFNRQDKETLKSALRKFIPEDFDPEEIREHARKFSPAVFREQLLSIISSARS